MMGVRWCCATPNIEAADVGGCERQVWDLAAGACVQTVQGAHENVIMGLVNWQVQQMCQLCCFRVTCV